MLQQATVAIVGQAVKLKKDKKDGTTTIVVPSLNTTLDDELEEEAVGLLYHFRAMKIRMQCSVDGRPWTWYGPS